MKKYIQWLGETCNYFTKNKLYEVKQDSISYFNILTDAGNFLLCDKNDSNIKIFENIVIVKCVEGNSALTCGKKYFADYTYFTDNFNYLRILDNFNEWNTYIKSKFICPTAPLPSKKLEISEKQILQIIKENPESKIAFQKLFPDLIKKPLIAEDLKEIRANMITTYCEDNLAISLSSEYDYILENNFLIPKHKK